MELLKLLEAAASSGVLALLLAMLAVGYQTRELRRVRAECQAENEACEKRAAKNEAATRELFLFLRAQGGGRRKVKLPDLSEYLGDETIAE